jgi:alanine racemase
MATFAKTTEDLPGERTTCNSAGLLRHANDVAVAADWVRPGIALYGSAPDFPERDIAAWDLQPTMSLRSRIIATQDLQAGDTVGYGSSFTADAPMRIGIVACGYECALEP